MGKLVLTQGINDVTTLILPDGREITVMVCAVRSGKKVRIGYDAPSDVQIVRSTAKKKHPTKA